MPAVCRFHLLAAIATLGAAVAPAASPVAATKPAGLKPGDTIMIVAPAGELVPSRIATVKKRLEGLGFKVVYQEDLFSAWGYLAGTDERRAAELMSAFTNPEVDAVFPGTGGYGTMRILDLLDYDAIRANPKALIGFSDITGLHCALAARCNLVTFHSPTPQGAFSRAEGFHPFPAKYFWRALLAEENRGPENGGEAGWLYEPPTWAPLGMFAPGAAEGPLCGGNLSLVAALTGTKHQLDTDGRVLFLEDVHEAPYRIDRMLRQMKLSGQLDRPAAVVLGQFTDCEHDGDGSSLSLLEVFLDYFGGAPYPVVCNFPAGHVTLNATLPLGVRTRVDANLREVRVLENAVQ